MQKIHVFILFAKLHFQTVYKYIFFTEVAAFFKPILLHNTKQLPVIAINSSNGNG